MTISARASDRQEKKNEGKERVKCVWVREMITIIGRVYSVEETNETARRLKVEE